MSKEIIENRHLFEDMVDMRNCIIEEPEADHHPYAIFAKWSRKGLDNTLKIGQQDNWYIQEVETLEKEAINPDLTDKNINAHNKLTDVVYYDVKKLYEWWKKGDIFMDFDGIDPDTKKSFPNHLRDMIYNYHELL